ncbi:MAG TPA: ABC transporter permease [Candidatus Dormibacteraeota bacterium]|nr:ABC transporter permease [Candidatus Dormibacteraeota bacterium]
MLETGGAMRRKPGGAIRPGRVALLAAAALVYLFIFLPLIFVTMISFFTNEIISFPAHGYTLRWYLNILQQIQFVQGFAMSFQVAIFAMVAGVVLGTLAAIALTRYRFPGRDFFNTLLLSPLLVPGIVAGTALYVFFVQIEKSVGLALMATLPGLVLAHVTLTIPWTVRLISASLLGIDRSVEEAAMNLGASRWVTFLRITLPLIRPGIVAGALFSFIVSFGNLEMSLFLVGPGRTTLPIAILQYLSFNLDPTIAAVSVVEICIVGAAMLVTNRFVRITAIV